MAGSMLLVGSTVKFMCGKFNKLKQEVDEGLHYYKIKLRNETYQSVCHRYDDRSKTSSIRSVGDGSC